MLVSLFYYCACNVAFLVMKINSFASYRSNDSGLILMLIKPLSSIKICNLNVSTTTRAHPYSLPADEPAVSATQI